MWRNARLGPDSPRFALKPSHSLPRAVPRLLLALPLVLLLAACGGPEPRADVEDLRLIREGSDYPTITGYVVNRGEVDIASADVFVTLYDADNRPLDDVLVQVRRVPVGDSSRFEQGLDLQASGARLKYVAAN